MQPIYYIAITVSVYFDLINPVTTQIKRFLRFYNLSKAMLIWRQPTLSQWAHFVVSWMIYEILPHQYDNISGLFPKYLHKIQKFKQQLPV